MTNADIFEKIRAALAAKGGPKACTVCGNFKWVWGPSFVRLTSTSNANRPGSGQLGYPSIPMLCQVCGNTHLLNLIFLGFSTEEIEKMVLTQPGDASKQ